MDLAARCLELVDVPSESRDEAELHGHVLRVLGEGGAEDVRDAGDTCVVAGPQRPRVLLCGHLDTVPAQGNRPGRVGGGAVHGLGASDMKGALAVMVELALARAPFGFVFFGREELPVAESALTPLLDREPALRQAELAVMMEPTANVVQAGCLGNLNARWTFTGRAGHSARPWQADNALHAMARGIAALADVAPVEHRSGGFAFTEVVSVTRAHAGVADNVVPGEAWCHVNARSAPHRSGAEAEAWLRSLTGPHGGALEVVSNAPPAPVIADHPLLDALRDAGDGLALEPKQAWTPIAELHAAGVPAVNFGPGDPAQAHQAGEHVRVDALERSFAVLERFAREAL